MTEETDDEAIVDEDTATGFPALTIDWELYGQYLEDSDLSDEDKRAFIETLWSIMVSFVDLGFRVSPVQEICGEVDPLAALAENSLQDMVRSNPIQNTLEKAADGFAIPSPEKESADES